MHASYLEKVKGDLVKFIDQLHREVDEISQLEDDELRSTRTSANLKEDILSIKAQVAAATDEPVLQRLHEIFAGLATKAMFHRMAANLRVQARKPSKFNAVK